jgi:hypothetical protein
MVAKKQNPYTSNSGLKASNYSGLTLSLPFFMKYVIQAKTEEGSEENYVNTHPTSLKRKIFYTKAVELI